MEEKRQFSDVEILQDAVETLFNLNLPIRAKEELGDPIFRVAKNLDILLGEMMRREEMSAAAEAEAQKTAEAVTEEVAEEATVDGQEGAEIIEIGNHE